MRMSISRGIGLSLAFAMLGFMVACAPNSNPEPYPQKTAETTPVAETPAATETATETEAPATPAENAEAAAPVASEPAAAGETPVAGETPAAAPAEASKEIAPVAQDSVEAVAKAKAETQAVEKKDRTAATWEFTITDSALVATDPKPVLVDDVTFKIVNKAKEDYIFKLEGIDLAPATVAAGKETTFKGIKFGPGGITASAVKASSENKNIATSQAKLDIQAPK